MCIQIYVCYTNIFTLHRHPCMDIGVKENSTS